MIAVVQRVSSGSVSIAEKVVSSIKHGYVILLGIVQNDTQTDLEKLVQKTVQMRIMEDADGKMNRSILDTGGEVLLVSQFTLCADISKGRRPSFIKAMPPSEAKNFYEEAILLFEKEGIRVQTGLFGAEMKVNIQNDGPVTILINSREL
jgi:D-tyrosyl-tRNA(Tyr) deacylase